MADEGKKKINVAVEQKPNKQSGISPDAKIPKSDIQKPIAVDSLRKIKKPIKTIARQMAKNGRSRIPQGRGQSISQELLEQQQKELRKAQGLPPRKIEEPIPGGPALKPHRDILTDDQQRAQTADEDENEPDFEGEEGQQPRADSENRSNVPAQNIPSPPEAENEESDDDSDGPNIKNSIANRAIDYAKKSLKNLLSKEVKTAVIAFVLEWWWAILLVILIIIGGFLLFSYFFGNAGRSPSETGKSMLQPYDPAKDKHYLSALLQLSGDKQVQELANWTFLTGLSNDLTKIKEEMQISPRFDKDQITQKIDEIQKNISAYSTKKDAANGKKVVQGIKDLMEIFSTLPVFTGASYNPLGGLIPSNYTDANNLHLYTPLRPCPGPKCPDPNKKHRTFQQFKNNTCDAVDLSEPKDTVIYAAFGGKVVRNGKDGIGHNVVYIQSSDGYLATYAHIDSSVKLNQAVTARDPIGKVADLKTGSHLHFELSKDGKCVVMNEQDLIDAKNNSKQAGYYLWQRMLTILKATS